MKLSPIWLSLIIALFMGLFVHAPVCADGTDALAPKSTLSKDMIKAMWEKRLMEYAKVEQWDDITQWQLLDFTKSMACKEEGERFEEVQMVHFLFHTNQYTVAVLLHPTNGWQIIVTSTPAEELFVRLYLAKQETWTEDNDTHAENFFDHYQDLFNQWYPELAASAAQPTEGNPETLALAILENDRHPARENLFNTAKALITGRMQSKSRRKTRVSRQWSDTVRGAATQRIPAHAETLPGAEALPKTGEVVRAETAKTLVDAEALLNPEELARAYQSWAKDVRDPFAWDLPTNATGPQIREELNHRISGSARLSHLCDLLGGRESLLATPDTQRLRNTWRIAHLLDLYSDVVAHQNLTEEQKDALAARWISQLKDCGLIDGLLQSPDDADFVLRLQGTLTASYVRGHTPAPDSCAATLSKKAAAMNIRAVKTFRETITHHAPLLFTYAALEGVVDGYPQWSTHHGWGNKKGVRLCTLLEDRFLYDDQGQTLRPLFQSSSGSMCPVFPKTIEEISLWHEANHSRNYIAVRDALRSLEHAGFFGAISGNVSTTQSSLRVFGRDPSTKTPGKPRWFNGDKNYDEILAAAKKFETEFRIALSMPKLKDRLSYMLRSFYGFDRKINPENYDYPARPTTIAGTLQNLQQEGLYDFPDRNPGRVLAMIAVMLLRLNEAIVPAGYYIHVDTAPAGPEGFTFTEVVGGSIVARRFIRTPAGEEFDQILVDAGRETYGYHKENTIVFPVTIIYTTYDPYTGSTYVEGQERINDSFKSRFTPVFLKDAHRLAREAQAPLREVVTWISDHEGRHGVDCQPSGLLRNPSQSQRFLQNILTLANQYAPRSLRELTALPHAEQQRAALESLLAEFSAMLQEAYADYNVFMVMREHIRNRSGLPYRIAELIIRNLIAAALRAQEESAGPPRNESEQDERIRQWLETLHQQFFSRPLGPLNTSTLVLPAFGTSWNDAIRRAAAGSEFRRLRRDAATAASDSVGASL